MLTRPSLHPRLRTVYQAVLFSLVCAAYGACVVTALDRLTHRTHYRGATPESISGVANDFNPTSLTTIANISATQPDVTIADESYGSRAAARFKNTDGLAELLKPGNAAIYIRSDLLCRWVFIGGVDSAFLPHTPPTMDVYGGGILNDLLLRGDVVRVAVHPAEPTTLTGISLDERVCDGHQHGRILIIANSPVSP